MEIKILNSNKIKDSEWDSYCKSFNTVFNKQYDIKYFKNKYLNTIDNQSYHALLISDNFIVGACSIIPFNYNIKSICIKIGLAVDVFIKQEFRKDPFTLLRMYKALKVHVLKHDISFVIAVPNDTAYSYWKNIVKWNDVGNIPYYALPVKISNIRNNLPKFFNIISQALSKLIIKFPILINKYETTSKIEIDKSKLIIYKQRYFNNYNLHNIESTFFSYRIVNENNIKTCYLVDFYNLNNLRKDRVSLKIAIKYILYKEDVDLILFVGMLKIRQYILFKVPYKYEPKHLNLTIDFIHKIDINEQNFLLNIKNWSFSLFNYDAR